MSGCGSFGMIIVPAAKRGLHVTGIDISSRALFLLKNRVKAMRLAHKVDLVLGDVTALPIGSEVFDAAVFLRKVMPALI
jgi:ubiquinone/menaquinone biosynthesis C-methylase UbiE